MAQPTAGRRKFRSDIGRTRRLLKRLPETVQAEVLKVYAEIGPAIEAVGKSQAPVRTGRLRSALRFRILPRSLRFEFGLIGRKINRQLFYARILEQGRKAQTSKPFQRRMKNGKLTRRYTMQIKAIPFNRYDFVYGRVRAYAKQIIAPKLKTLFTKALRNAAGV